MNTHRVILLAFIVVCSLGAQTPESKPVPPASAGQKLNAADAKRFVGEALGADAKKAAAARTKLQAVRPEDRKFIFDALASAPFQSPPPPKAGSDKRAGSAKTLTFDVPDAPTKKGTVIILAKDGSLQFRA